MSHNALFFEYDHARINFTSALTSFVGHVPCSPRTLASRTSRLVSFCSLIAEASAGTHATRTVFLFSLLTSSMLSLVVDRYHAKVVWWITALVGPVSTTPVSPQSRRPFSKESADGSVMWVDARWCFVLKWLDQDTSRLLEQAKHSKWRCLGRRHQMRVS